MGRFSYAAGCPRSTGFSESEHWPRFGFHTGLGPDPQSIVAPRGHPADESADHHTVEYATPAWFVIVASAENGAAVHRDVAPIAAAIAQRGESIGSAEFQCRGAGAIGSSAFADACTSAKDRMQGHPQLIAKSVPTTVERLQRGDATEAQVPTRMLRRALGSSAVPSRGRRR